MEYFSVSVFFFPFVVRVTIRVMISIGRACTTTRRVERCYTFGRVVANTSTCEVLDLQPYPNASSYEVLDLQPYPYTSSYEVLDLQPCGTRRVVGCYTLDRAIFFLVRVYSGVTRARDFLSLRGRMPSFMLTSSVDRPANAKARRRRVNVCR